MIGKTPGGKTTQPPKGSEPTNAYGLRITIDSTAANANGVNFNLPTAVEKKNNVIFAPIASIVEAFKGTIK